MAKIKIFRNWGALIGLTIPNYCFYIDNLEVTDNILLEGELEIELNSGIHKLSLVSREKRKSKLIKELEFYVNQEDESYYLVESNLVVTRVAIGLLFFIGALIVNGEAKNFYFVGIPIVLILTILLTILGMIFCLISFYLDHSGCGIRLVSES